MAIESFSPVGGCQSGGVQTGLPTGFARMIKDFGFGCVLAVAVLTGMVLVQYAGERLEKQVAAPHTLQAGR